MSDEILFRRQGTVWLAYSIEHPDVVGSGYSKDDAVTDYYHRRARGWNEERKQRLIKALEIGLVSQERLAHSCEEKQRLIADRVEVEDLIRHMKMNLFVLLEEDHGA